MKFAHMADAHIGSWREPRLKEASLDAFVKAVKICFEQNVDFILISGDLFNTSLPAIDKLKEVVIQLKHLNESNIPTYIIPGSHDFSPSGKTMLDVLENAGLVVNVVKGTVDKESNKLKLRFSVDKKTGAKITGMLGKKGMLEKHYYESLETKNLEDEQGFKIFMFHTALTELKPKSLADMDSAPISLLPKGFDYYAGGHVHIIEKQKIDGYGVVVYPGPLFPNNFKELEELKCGGFNIWDDGKINYFPLQLYDVKSIVIDCSNKSPEEVRYDILKNIDKIVVVNNTIVQDETRQNNLPLDKQVEHKITDLTPSPTLTSIGNKNIIVTLRLKGVLREGKINDIALNELIERLYERGVYYVMKNTSKLSTKEFEEVKLSLEKSHDIEKELIKQHLSKSNTSTFSNMLTCNEHDTDNASLIKDIMKSLDLEKQEGERIIDFEQRIKENIKKLFQT